MPCFKGIAVSVHADGAPLSEHSIQKHSKTGRITTYIPVPPPKPSSKTASGLTEKSKFAISITLLTPGLAIPYSTPKATDDNPDPKPQLVGESRKGAPQTPRSGAVVGPYEPLTSSSNETIAAYIYFDGRSKEEVATLLRPGEETWVNSRWVHDSSGGLAEREFLFREVGLERWLNGLDLEKEGQAAKVEQRREKLRKRRERLLEKEKNAMAAKSSRRMSDGQGLLAYGSDAQSPTIEFTDEDEYSDDDEPPEATGQIKVAMFRVLASGEIKKGEYSPQFDASDDGDAMDAANDEADHTTSFAKPKALDPKSISTQTVTGLDGPESPYAVFTFLYRGERQLRKMGILPPVKGRDGAPTTGKRASRQIDFANLPPLKSSGTVGFTAFRDTNGSTPNKSRKISNSTNKASNGDDSEDEDDEDIKLGEPDDADDKDVKKSLSAEERKTQGELMEGVNRIKLKRQRSTELSSTRQSPAVLASPNIKSTPSPDIAALPPPNFGSSLFGGLSSSLDDVGSPLKKHRSSVHQNIGDVANGVGRSLPSADILGTAEASQQLQPKTFSAPTNNQMEDEDIEL